jgi:hypothetical protein
MNPAPHVRAPALPLFIAGYPSAYLGEAINAPYPATVRAPKIPLYQLGARGLRGLRASRGMGASSVSTILPLLIGPAIVSKSGGAVSSALESAAAGAAQGSKFGPIGAAVGAVAGAISGLWASHNARAAGAKNENTALNSAVIAFDGSLKAIFAAANSTELSSQITAPQAIQLLQQTLMQYWQGMAPFTSGPGAADASGGGTKCSSVVVCNQQSSPGLKCDKSCTAGCCVGCDVFTPTINQAIAIFNAGGGTLNVCEVYGSGYGATTRPSYTLTYTSPTAAATAAGGTASAAGSAAAAVAPASVVSGFMSETIAGVPVWMVAAGVAAYLVLKR